MDILIIVAFVTGYVLIALEHTIRINKTATAILTGVICWTLFVFMDPGAVLLESHTFSAFKEVLSIERPEEQIAAMTPDEIHRAFVGYELNEHLAAIAQ